jgi:uncharacterized protein (DUF2132 family)
MSEEQPKNILHGLTLKAIVEHLFELHGWDGLAKRVRINCFANDPSLKSSLKFLRRTPWAREQIEQLYLFELREARRVARREAANKA